MIHSLSYVVTLNPRNLIYHCETKSKTEADLSDRLDREIRGRSQHGTVTNLFHCV